METQAQQKTAGATAQRPTVSGSRRRLTTRALGGVSSLLLLCIVLMANYLGFRHYKRFDWTGQGLFTLSDKSKSIVRALGSDVDIYLFLSTNEGNFAETEELLKRYQAVSSHVRIHRIDPDREPAKFQMLAQRFGLGATLLESGEFGVDVAAMVTSGNRKWSIKRDDLVGFGSGMPGEDGSERVDVKAEQALTGAIVQVTGGRATKLCLTKGHDEWPLEGGDGRSIAPLKEALRHDNIEWEDFDTLGKTSVPKGCDAVLVIGPKRAFSEGEARLIGEYLRKGGKVLLTLDPVLERDQIQATGFEDMARQFGISIDRSLLVEPNKERLVSSSTLEFLVTDFGEHEITRAMVGRGRVLMALVRSVRPTQQSGAEVLMRSSAESFAKLEIAELQPGAEPVKGDRDLGGPAPLGVIAQIPPASDAGGEKNSKSGRLLVIGDSDWLQGALLGSPELANYHLASACIGSIAERKALVEIPAKKARAGSAMFTQSDLSGLFFRVVVILPAVALLLGIIVWIKRRS